MQQQLATQLKPVQARLLAQMLYDRYGLGHRPQLAAYARATALVLELYLLHATWVLNAGRFDTVLHVMYQDLVSTRLRQQIKERCEQARQVMPEDHAKHVATTANTLFELVPVARHLRAVAEGAGLVLLNLLEQLDQAVRNLSQPTALAPVQPSPPAALPDPAAHRPSAQRRPQRPDAAPPLRSAACATGAAASAEQPAAAGAPMVVLYEQQEVHERLLQADSNAQPPSALAQRLQAMLRGDPRRPLAMATTVAALDALYARFPHFAEVLDFVRQQLALQMPRGLPGAVRISPVLLVGEPGTGKTRFCSELAQALGLAYVERDLSVTSEAFVLTGMDSAWHGAKPGVVYDALVGGKWANPMIALHEIDKVGTERGMRNSPLNALYALLEPHSARRFVDEFVGIKLDASAIIWVMTANSAELPAPLLSRCEVFRVPTPTPAQSHQVAQSVWLDVLARLPAQHGFPTELPEPLLELLARMTPRQMRKAAERACGNAALAGRAQLTADDFNGAQRCVYERRCAGFY